MADIDVDVSDSATLVAALPHVRASVLRDGDLAPHPSGVYPWPVPVDPVTGLCALPASEAEKLGIVKLDIITNSLYRRVRDRAELQELVKTEPDWDLLLDRDCVSVLPQLHSQYAVVRRIAPRSIPELAATLALIRPAKRHLLDLPRDEALAKVWEPNPDGSYGFKKSHAFAYALLVVAALNLYSSGRLTTISGTDTPP